MKISVLLPTLFPELAHGAIESLRPQLAGIDHEFVVVSPVEISGANVRWVRDTERRGSIVAARKAAEHATGDLWLNTNDDFRFSGTAIAEALAAFADPARPFPLALTYPHRMRALDCIYAAYGRITTTVFFTGKADAAQVGGLFDPAFRHTLGDADFSMRVIAANGTVRRARARIQGLTDRSGNGVAPRPSDVIGADLRRFEEKWAPRFDPIWNDDPAHRVLLIAADALPILSPGRPDTLVLDGPAGARDLRIVRAMTLVAYHNNSGITTATLEAGLKYFRWAAKLSPHPLQVNVSGWYWAGVTRAPGDPQGQAPLLPP